ARAEQRRPDLHARGGPGLGVEPVEGGGHVLHGGVVGHARHEHLPSRADGAVEVRLEETELGAPRLPGPGAGARDRSASIGTPATSASPEAAWTRLSVPALASPTASTARVVSTNTVNASTSGLGATCEARVAGCRNSRFPRATTAWARESAIASRTRMVRSDTAAICGRFARLPDALSAASWSSSVASWSSRDAVTLSAAARARASSQATRASATALARAIAASRPGPRAPTTIVYERRLSSHLRDRPRARSSRAPGAAASGG